ncbi:MAG: N-acetyltransferase [Candidatus Omnitrophica bacterium]|nr:N-acetyltransferase [Candidatus Omnitrophota bacterium]
MIRKATLADAGDIHNLINSWAKKGKVLKRPINYVFEHLRDFWVFIVNNKIIGCCSLNIVGWQDLAEIKSLAVKAQFHRKGIGRKLVQKCLEEAVVLGVKEVFALTFVPEFFRKLGFKNIDRKKLPHKIWSDCINCTYFPNCQEQAMILKLKKI